MQFQVQLCQLFFILEWLNLGEGQFHFSVFFGEKFNIDLSKHLNHFLETNHYRKQNNESLISKQTFFIENSKNPIKITFEKITYLTEDWDQEVLNKSLAQDFTMTMTLMLPYALDYTFSYSLAHLYPRLHAKRFTCSLVYQINIKQFHRSDVILQYNYMLKYSLVYLYLYARWSINDSLVLLYWLQLIQLLHK